MIPAACLGLTGAAERLARALCPAASPPRAEPPVPMVGGSPPSGPRGARRWRERVPGTICRALGDPMRQES